MKSYAGNFTFVFIIPMKFAINFLRLPQENIVFGVITDNYIYSL